MFIERKSCPICNNKKLKIFKNKVDNQTIIKFLEEYYNKKLPQSIYEYYDYKILECEKCSLKFQKFICNEELSILLYEEIIDRKESFNKKKNLSFKNFQEYIQDMNLISKLYKKKSRDIEISKTRLNFLNDCKINTLREIDLNKEYDFIYSNQVFEHLNFPELEFSKLVSVLKKDSFLLIKVPSSFLHLQKEILNKHSYKNILFPLEHINLYNKKVFKFLAKKYNLKISNHYILKLNSLYGISLFVKNTFTNSFVLFKKN